MLPNAPVPPPNPRQAGVAPRQRRPWLIGGWTAPWQVELGRSGLILALLDSRLPLRQGKREPPRGDLRQIQGVAPRQRWPGLTRCWTAPGRAKLGSSSLICALLDSRLPLRRGETGTRVRWTCAESKAGGFCTASEAARPNSGLGSPLSGGVMSLRLNFGPSRLENAPEAGRKVARARGTFAKSKSGRCCTTSEVARVHLGLESPLGRQSYIV